MTASFLVPNFRVGLTMTAWLPVFLVLSTVELLAGRVVPDPFDGSTVVKGMVRPTTVSSPDAVVCGILAAGLQSQKNFKIKPSKSTNGVKYSISYLPAARSL